MLSNAKFPGILSDWGVRLRVCTSRYSIVFALKIMCSQLPGASSNEAPFSYLKIEKDILMRSKRTYFNGAIYKPDT